MQYTDAQIFLFGTTQTSGENLKFGRLGIFGDHPLFAQALQKNLFLNLCNKSTKAIN